MMSDSSETMLSRVETDTSKLAESVDSLIEQLSGYMRDVTMVTTEAVDLHRSSVASTCDSVDNTIKSMYQLMVKIEQLNSAMRKVHPLAEQVSELKRLMDILEKVDVST